MSTILPSTFEYYLARGVEILTKIKYQFFLFRLANSMDQFFYVLKQSSEFLFLFTPWKFELENCGKHNYFFSITIFRKLFCALVKSEATIINDGSLSLIALETCVSSCFENPLGIHFKVPLYQHISLKQDIYSYHIKW